MNPSTENGGGSNSFARRSPARVALFPQGHEREALARAEVAVLAIGEARRTGNLDERREWLLLAQSSMLKSLHRLEADLERLSA